MSATLSGIGADSDSSEGTNAMGWGAFPEEGRNVSLRHDVKCGKRSQRKYVEQGKRRLPNAHGELMVTVPGFLLRRLYVKKSLKNTASGFEFHLSNRLGSGYTHKLWPLTVDGRDVPLEKTFFVLEGRETAFNAVSKENTFTIAMNKAITVRVDDAVLDPGPRKIGMGFDVPGLGTLRFDFTDLVPDE